jgi:hypothetical protein
MKCFLSFDSQFMPRALARGIGGQSIETRGKAKTMGFQYMRDRLTEICESAVEYETRHKDAGDNYAFLVAESWCSDQENALIDFMREKGIDWTGLEIDAIADCVLDQFEMQSGHIWGAGNGDCLLIAFPIGEIEIQIAARDIGLTQPVSESFCDRLSRATDFVCRKQNHDTILAYQGTDSVWDACISEKALREIVADLRAQG